MRPFVLIPSRLKATRLPNKPLADIAGAPMIVQVWRRAREADVGPVVVAAGRAGDLDAIRQAGGRGGADARRPRRPDPTGIHEALGAIRSRRPLHDVVVTCRATCRRSSRRACAQPGTPFWPSRTVDIGTIAAEIVREEDRVAPQVVEDRGRLRPPGRGRRADRPRALFLARDHPVGGRAALPPYRGSTPIAVRRSSASWRCRRGPLEQRESLEQLPARWRNGMRIDVARVDTVPLGVDTPDDLARARAMLSGH
jgi:3-deoxy-manno-octulosonate cytidylyltransferase (CMP-KDO synthetase)